MTAEPIESLKFLTPDDVREVAQCFGTPVFVYDEQTIEAGVRTISSLPSAFGLTVRYSLKACPSAAIVCLFDRLGLCFDASSVWEVHRAVRAGIDPARILLTAQQAVFDDGLLALLDAGLQFDAGSVRQLEDYGRARPGGDVSIRLNPGFGSGLVRRLTSGGPESSFGIWHEAIHDVERALESHGLRLVRVHTHVGSGHDPGVLVRAAAAAIELARRFATVQTVNLGGGYRVKALLADPEPDHAGWAAMVAGEMGRFAVETGRELALELEPGTYLMANAGSIVTKILDVTTTGSAGHTFLKIDGGLTEILRPSYYGAPHPLVTVAAQAEPEPRPAERYCVAGHCCIAGDVLTTAVADVERLAPVALGRAGAGDYLVVERGGAYCSSMAMRNFNSYPDAAEVLRRRDGSFHLIRARQTLDQIVANERVPADLRSVSTESSHYLA
ncbi:MAG: diaminopimelate decarboxylase [Actinobacteria bacterium]|nr:diaminopimelate decarboxylase [Actinomycetota bacterium]